MKYLIKQSVGGFIGLLCLLFSAQALAEPEYTLTMQSSDKPGVFMFEKASGYAKWVEEMSNGRVKIKVVPANSVVPHNEVLTAVGKGEVLQGEFDDPSYFAAIDPAFSFIGNTVGAWSDTEEAFKFFYYDEGMKIARKLYEQYNVYLIGLAFPGVESLVSSILLTGIDDLKNLRMRVPEGMVHDVFKAAGAETIIMPGSEVYNAIATGQIDAADQSVFSVNQNLRLHDIAHYPVQPGFHSLPLHAITINLDLWKSLPKDLQSIMETAVMRMATDVLFGYQLQDAEAVKEARAQGVTIVNWSKTERSKFRDLSVEQWKPITDRSAISKEFADALMKYFARYSE